MFLLRCRHRASPNFGGKDLLDRWGADFLRQRSFIYHQFVRARAGEPGSLSIKMAVSNCPPVQTSAGGVAWMDYMLTGYVSEMISLSTYLSLLISLYLSLSLTISINYVAFSNIRFERNGLGRETLFRFIITFTCSPVRIGATITIINLQVNAQQAK